VINASEGLPFHITTAGGKCREAAVNSCPVLHFSIVFVCFFGIIDFPALLSVENRVPLKPVLGDVRDIAFFHYTACTDSIKRSLHFSCNFVVINALDGSPGLYPDLYRFI
jgi:hypothetical protein